MVILLITSLALASAYYWYIKHLRIDALRKKRTIKAKPTLMRQKLVQPQYRCVAITPGHEACQSAKQLKSTLILMDEAPSLPLKTCDVSKCHCRYLRYDDRRMETRRNDLYKAELYMNNQKSRRKKQGRRKNDKPYSDIEHGLGTPTISLL
jgi:hypothetical protein